MLLQRGCAPLCKDAPAARPESAPDKCRSAYECNWDVSLVEAKPQSNLECKFKVTYDEMNSIMASHPLALLADAGVPMILIAWPGMLVLLLPIIAAEAAFIIKHTALPHKRVVWATASANAVSTVVGIPLTWGILFVCEMGFWEGFSHTSIGSGRWNSPLARIIGTIFSAPWLMPIGKRHWAIPLAALVLLIPFLFVSVWVEQQVMKLFFRLPRTDDSLRKAVWGANVVSYGFLFLFAVVWLLWGALQSLMWRGIRHLL